MLDVYLAKTLGGALKPVDGAGEEYVAALGQGEIIRAQLKKERNPGHHRKFFGLLRMVFKNQETYLSEEALRFAVMIQAGYVESVVICGVADHKFHVIIENLHKIAGLLGGCQMLTEAAEHLSEYAGASRTVLKPKSISWAKMDQHEFEKFYSAALAAIPRLLPQFEGIDLDRELLNTET